MIAEKRNLLLWCQRLIVLSRIPFCCAKKHCSCSNSSNWGIPRIFLYKGVINNFGKVNLIKSFNLMSAHNLSSAVCNAGWSLGFSSIWIILRRPLSSLLHLSCGSWFLITRGTMILYHRAPVFCIQLVFMRGQTFQIDMNIWDISFSELI